MHYIHAHVTTNATCTLFGVIVLLRCPSCTPRTGPCRYAQCISLRYHYDGMIIMLYRMYFLSQYDPLSIGRFSANTFVCGVVNFLLNSILYCLQFLRNPIRSFFFNHIMQLPTFQNRVRPSCTTNLVSNCLSLPFSIVNENLYQVDASSIHRRMAFRNVFEFYQHFNS